MVLPAACISITSYKLLAHWRLLAAAGRWRCSPARWHDQYSDKTEYWSALQECEASQCCAPGVHTTTLRLRWIYFLNQTNLPRHKSLRDPGSPVSWLVSWLQCKGQQKGKLSSYEILHSMCHIPFEEQQLLPSNRRYGGARVRLKHWGSLLDSILKYYQRDLEAPQETWCFAVWCHALMLYLAWCLGRAFRIYNLMTYFSSSFLQNGRKTNQFRWSYHLLTAKDIYLWFHLSGWVVECLVWKTRSLERGPEDGGCSLRCRDASPLSAQCHHQLTQTPQWHTW